MASEKTERPATGSGGSSASAINVAVLIFTLVSSFLFGSWLNPPPPFTKKDLLRGLESLAQVPSLPEDGASGTHKKHLAIGFNANLDALVADGPAFLRSLAGVDEYAKAADVVTVNTAKEFGQVFAHHFQSASAGERAIGNDTLWAQIVEHLDNFEDDEKLGGNAALMAEAVAKGFHDTEVTLMGMSGAKIAGKLSSRVKILAGDERTVTIGSQKYPAKHDQIHLILEYPADSKFGSFKAQRANRFIVSRDFANGAIASLESLSKLRREKVDALVIAGIHIMDGMLPKDIRSQRLQQTKQELERFPRTRVHLEMGSTGDAAFSKEIVTSLEFDSLGLNEQEFFTICESFGICKAEERASMASAIPPVIKIQAAIAGLFEALPTLSRIHFHCFSYHIVAQRSSSRGAVWPNPARAVAAGSVVATTRACAARVKELHGNKLNLSVSSIKVSDDAGRTQVVELKPDAPVAVFEFKGIMYNLAPVVSCAVPKQTVGLGDFISAYALASQL